MHSSRMRTARTLTKGGGSPSGGVLHLGGFSIWGGSPSRGVLHLGGVSIWGGSPSRGVSIRGGVPCDLSHHAFDVTCMLPPHQLCTCLYTAWSCDLQCILGYHPSCGQTDTCKNITFANYVCGR